MFKYSQLLLPDGLRPVEGSPGHWVELQVLVECPPRFVAVRESLLLVMDRKEVESRHQKNVDRERDARAVYLRGVPPAGERGG